MKNPPRCDFRAQRGFTLLELVVAMTIAVFLLSGLFATLQSTRHAYAQQNELAQLQDNQRLAMTLMADVVESAGYFPKPSVYAASAFLPAIGAWTLSQSVIGTANAAAPGDTITVRYGADATNDNTFNCVGRQNATGATTTFYNTFKVVVDAAGVSWLVCNDGTTDYQLVKDVTNMKIVYGVHLGPVTGSCTDTYQTSAQMVATPANWANVCSINLTLTFVNRVSLVTGGTVSMQRNIALMNMAGAST
jgi:type IV pilus assembly protein PilW